MKKTVILTMLVSLLLGVIVAAVYAATPDVKPCKVVIGLGKNRNYATFNGLKVRINEKKDEFFSHNYFISYPDLKKLAAKRKVSLKLDEKAKKMMMGKKKFDLVAVNPKSKSGTSYRTILYVNYKGKTYYDTWGIYPGLGCVSVSKTRDGVLYGLPKKK